MICIKIGCIWFSCSREEIKNAKNLQTDDVTDDGQWVIRKAHLNIHFSTA